MGKHYQVRLGVNVFSTGQVAELMGVAPRTASKMIDSGKLKGYRIPSSKDRRVPRDNLISFMREHGMPLGSLERIDEYHVLAVGLDQRTRARLEEQFPDGGSFRFQHAADTFSAALELSGDLPPDAMLLDLTMGRSEGLAIAARVMGDARYRGLEVILLTCEDETADFAEAGYTEVFKREFDVMLLAECLRALARVKWGE